MADFETITKHMEQLAIQHNIGSNDCPSNMEGKQNDVKADAEQLLVAFMNKLNLTDSIETPCADAAGSDDSDIEVDPSHNFDDLALIAHSFKAAAVSTHQLAANLRKYSEKENLTEHHRIASYIARDLCLRRIDAVVIECQAADHIERKGGPQASTPEEKQRLRRMFEQAEDGISTLGALEIELIDLSNICMWAGRRDCADSVWGSILVELMRLEVGGEGEEERAPWNEAWLNNPPLLPDP